jgi:glycosyltransferase involved in cell wall biosynthesis
MKLLVLTQAVDLDDPVLGFFHRWLEEFAQRFEHIHVICLKEGRHALPENVMVHSLGKEGGRSRAKYIRRFYAYLWSLRREYDAVFVHMNEEYMLLGGLPWKMLGKKATLWRNYKTGSWMTPSASKLADAVFYTSPDSFVARYANAVQMPIGIDTRQFVPPQTPPTPRTILFLGRFDAVKNVDVFVEALKLLYARGGKFHADIYGSPTYAGDAYARAVTEGAEELVRTGVLTFHPAVSHDATPSIYSSHAIYVNLTPSGSFDKTIGEAMASGCLVVSPNGAVRDVLGEYFIEDIYPEAVAQILQKALELSSEDRAVYTASARQYIEKGHSLSLLSGRLVGVLDAIQ